MTTKTKTTYISTAPDGTQVEFASTRISTHAVMVQSERQSDGALSWALISTNGRYELAAKELAKWSLWLAANPADWASQWWEGTPNVVQRHVRYALVELTVKA